MRTFLVTITTILIASYIALCSPILSKASLATVEQGRRALEPDAVNVPSISRFEPQACKDTGSIEARGLSDGVSAVGKAARIIGDDGSLSASSVELMPRPIASKVSNLATSDSVNSQAEAVAAKKDKLKEQKRRWAQANPDKVRQSRENWRSLHPDKVRGYKAKWRLNHPENARINRANWRRNHPEKAKASKKRRIAETTARQVMTHEEPATQPLAHQIDLELDPVAGSTSRPPDEQAVATWMRELEQLLHSGGPSAPSTSHSHSSFVALSHSLEYDRASSLPDLPLPNSHDGSSNNQAGHHLRPSSVGAPEVDSTWDEYADHLEKELDDPKAPQPSTSSEVRPPQ